MTPVLSSNLPLSHDVYVARTGQRSFRPKGIHPGFAQLQEAREPSWALVKWPWAHPEPARAAERAAEPPRWSLRWSPRWPGDSSWSLGPRAFCGAITECSLRMNRKWTVLQTREITQLPQAELPKFKISWYTHTRGKKPLNQMLQTPRNPFAKDGKFFYTLFQNLLSIKS